MGPWEQNVSRKLSTHFSDALLNVFQQWSCSGISLFVTAERLLLLLIKCFVLPNRSQVYCCLNFPHGFFSFSKTFKVVLLY